MSSINTESINKKLKTGWLGRDLQLLESTTSTNSDIESLGRDRNRQKHGLILMADSQTKGRGRFNRLWFSPPGANLYFSMLLIPKKESNQIPSITLVAAVSLHEAINNLLPKLEIEIKWPNDILCNGKKIAGILSEYHQFPQTKPFVVVGIGLNVNSKEFPDELKNIASSLALESKKELSREDIFASICESFEKWYEAWEKEGLKSVKSYWEQNSGMVGKLIKANGNKGSVLGLSDSGALLIKDNKDKTIEVNSGEVEFLSN